MSLWDRFRGLPQSSCVGSYTVEPRRSWFRVARSFEGNPTVLIDFADMGFRGLAATRRLANISYQPPTMVELRSADGANHRARLAILECHTEDPELGAYFFRITDSILVESEVPVTEAAFENALDALITLFRALQRPKSRTVQGLWTELALILWSTNPGDAISSWHSGPHALHDFAAGSFRLEVKSTVGALREHSFLLDQLSTAPDGCTLIASVMLEDTSDGASVFDLIDAIVVRLGRAREATARLEVIVAESLGRDWRDARDQQFAVSSARRSLKIYAAADVPRVPQPLPPEVKDVRFVVDLSAVPDVSLAAARSLGEPFASILPGDDH